MGIIESRGEHVVTRNLVPVENVCRHIGVNQKDVPWLIQRYGITASDVFACIDFWADSNPIASKSFVSFDTDEAGGIVPSSMSDDVFFTIISYARMFYPKLEDLEKLFDHGIRIITLECFLDIRDGSTQFNNSNIHNLVLEEVTNVIGDSYDMDSVLTALDVDSYESLFDKEEEDDI